MRKATLHPVRRNVRLLLAHNVCQNVLFIIPVIVPYYRDALGLGFREFLLGEVAFSAVVVAMEVPGGYLADIFPRRVVLAIGSFAATVGFGMLLVARGFAMAVGGQMVVGIGAGLINGTNSALLYDTLLTWRLSGKFRRLEGLRQASGFYTVGAASLLSGVLYAVNIRLPLALDVATEAMAIVAALLLIEPRVHAARDRRNPFRDIARTLRYVRDHREVGALVLFCGVVFGTTSAGFWSQQPYYLARGIDPAWFGGLAFVGFMLAGLASQHGHRLERRVPHGAAFVAIVAGIAGCYALAGLFPGWWAIPLLYVSSLAYGFGMPLIQDALNARIDSSRRASILSTASLAPRLVFIPLGATVAAGSARFGIDWTLALTGLFLGLAGGLLLTRFRPTARP